MENIKNYFNGGHLIESFAFLPSISYNWMKTYVKGSDELECSWEFVFAWLFWYISIGNIKINLKKHGY